MKYTTVLHYDKRDYGIYVSWLVLLICCRKCAQYARYHFLLWLDTFLVVFSRGGGDLFRHLSYPDPWRIFCIVRWGPSICVGCDWTSLVSVHSRGDGITHSEHLVVSGGTLDDLTRCRLLHLAVITRRVCHEISVLFMKIFLIARR